MTSEKILFLLIPENLPISQISDSCNRDKLDRVLKLFAEAIVEPVHESALLTINNAIEILGGVILIRNQTFISSSAPLKPWEIEDFDNFFNIEHVDTPESAVCLVLSNLMAYQAWLELIINSNFKGLTEEELIIQKTGFQNSVNLFLRLFNIPSYKYYV